MSVLEQKLCSQVRQNLIKDNDLSGRLYFIFSQELEQVGNGMPIGTNKKKKHDAKLNVLLAL